MAQEPPDHHVRVSVLRHEKLENNFGGPGPNKFMLLLGQLTWALFEQPGSGDPKVKSKCLYKNETRPAKTRRQCSMLLFIVNSHVVLPGVTKCHTYIYASTS